MTSSALSICRCNNTQASVSSAELARTSLAVKESRPDVGSSRKSTRGLVTSARPMLVRLLCPPACRKALRVRRQVTGSLPRTWPSGFQPYSLVSPLHRLRLKCMIHISQGTGKGIRGPCVQCPAGNKRLADTKAIQQPASGITAVGRWYPEMHPLRFSPKFRLPLMVGGACANDSSTLGCSLARGPFAASQSNNHVPGISSCPGSHLRCRGRGRCRS